MKSFYRMKNQIRDYAWGHPHHIPHRLNLDWPEGKPAAEVWMGAHPSAPSQIFTEGQWIGLDHWITRNPADMLGPENAQKYGRLPFLLKFLAAGQSLSIQAHPNKAEAEEGFARENEKTIPLDSPVRNYRDNNHKPEIIMALTPFTVMAGFRNPREIAKNFHPLCTDDGEVFAMESHDARGVEFFFKNLLCLSAIQRDTLLEKALEYAQNPDLAPENWDKLQCEWVQRLACQFPSDIGALAPLFLHVVQIMPGEALYQPAKMLHAYLDGFGLELMANSDNVLRGGLTQKHIDEPELMRILEFKSTKPYVLELPAGRDLNSLGFFPTPAEEFALGLGDITRNPKSIVQIPGGEGPLIILNLDGTLHLNDGSHTLSLETGQSAFVPYIAPHISITGDGRVAVAELGR